MYPNQPAIHPTEFPKNYYVAVYGLLGAPAPVRPVVNQDRRRRDGCSRGHDAAGPGHDDVSADRCRLSGLHRCAARSRAMRQPSIESFSPRGRRFPAALCCGSPRPARTTGLATAFGIGFWSAQAAGGNQAAENSGLFVAKGQLKAAGTATLLSGSPATLHEFVGVANCPASGSEPLEPAVQTLHAL